MTDYTPKPVTPDRATLDRIIARQYRYAAVDQVDADAHLRVAHAVERLRDELFPRHPQDRRLYGGPL